MSRRFAPVVPLPLEARLLWSVSYDANGYTLVTPSVDSRVIYVSSSAGSDASTGLSAAAPVATLAKAQSLVRSGMPDEILLNRGDTFHGNFNNWQASGRSASEPMLIGTYGTGPRPLVDSGTSGAGFLTTPGSTTPVNFLDVIGVAFEPLDRDPTSAAYHAGSAGGTTGFRFYAPGGNLLIEDCSFQYYVNNLDIEVANGTAVTGNVTIRRTISANSYSSNSHSQGIYAYGVTRLTITQCVFDHDGWNTSVPGAGEQGYNHDMYFSSNTSGVVVQGNVIADASFCGINARSGGNIDDNLFVDDPVAVSYGEANGADSTVGGVVGSLVGNEIVGTASFQGTVWGEGFEIGNTKPGAGLLVADNIFTADSQFSSPAIELDMATSTLTPSVCVGENDVTVADNIFNGFAYTVEISGQFVPGGTGLYGLTDIKVLGNDFLNASKALVRDDGSVDPTQETFAGNRYYDPGLAPLYWARLQGVSVGIQAWLAAFDTTGAVLPSLPYADPTRTVATYDGTTGDAGTIADFVAQAELISPTDYRPQFMAQAVLDYVRGGYAIDTTPPTAAATAPPVNDAALGNTAYTFTVAYADETRLNASSITSGDLLVTGPDGFSQTPTLLSTAAPTLLGDGGQQIVATYQVTPPAGAWGGEQDGTYTVGLLPNAVTDAAGNVAAAGTIGTFTVDLAPPTVTAAAPPVTTADLGNTAYTFTVTYADAVGIDLTSLDSNQVQVSGPNGYAQTATLVGDTASGNGTTVTATYAVTPPGDAWAAGQDGTYTVALAGDPVRDLAGNAAAQGMLTTFTAALASAPATNVNGTISGYAYVDANGNGAYDAREVPLAGVTVFLDLAGTGELAAGDPTAVTAADGSYSFVDVAPGKYTAAAVSPNGYQATSRRAQAVTVVSDGTVANVDFGQQVTATVVNGGTPHTRPILAPAPIRITTGSPTRVAPISLSFR